MNANEDQPAPPEMAEADRIAQESVARLSEHCDAVTIFISRRREFGRDGTLRAVFGAGNWYARYGQVKQWIIAEEAEAAGLDRTRKPED